MLPQAKGNTTKDYLKSQRIKESKFNRKNSQIISGAPEVEKIKRRT